MKISLRKYAKILAESLETKEDSQSVAKKIQNLLKLLVKKKQSRLIKYLPAVFKEIWLKKDNKIEIKLSLPNDPSKEDLASLTKLLNEAFEKEVILEVKESPEILGGMKLEFGEYIINGTISSALEKLKHHIITA